MANSQRCETDASILQKLSQRYDFLMKSDAPKKGNAGEGTG
jgi:phage protein D